MVFVYKMHTEEKNFFSEVRPGEHGHGLFELGALDGGVDGRRGVTSRLALLASW